ncbi:hypothetical protein [Streptomyces lydicus]|uniref:hypothetical protein n=1 Tax=Streptomyces lydicus TaxID=47763 RepID=UPI0037A474E0
MAVRAQGQTAHVRLRSYTPGDEKAVLLLVEADRIAGQPPATPKMLAEALAARSPVDSGWWAQLDAPRTNVAVDNAGNLVGVVSEGVYVALFR